MPLPEEHAALLPEDIRSDPTLQNYNDFGSMAKSFIETKAMVGRSIQLPAKDGKPEDFDKWAGETGAKLKDYGYTVAKPNEPPPEKPDAYDFKVEGFDPQAIKSDIVANSFKEFAHGEKLSQAQANRFVEWWAKKGAPAVMAKMDEAQAAQQIEMIEQPEQRDKILGEVFQGAHKQALELRDNTITTLKAEIPELEDFLTGTAPYGAPWMTNRDHPAMVKLLNFVGEMKQQDFGGHVTGLTAADTMDSVDDEISKLRAESNATSDQRERNRIGDKITQLYLKKTALMKMKKAS
jgi:hypothetical protein